MERYSEVSGAEGPLAVVQDQLDEVCFETLQGETPRECLAVFLENYAEEVRQGRFAEEEEGGEQETWAEGGRSTGHGKA